MTDLINWDEPIEAMDGEPCRVKSGPDCSNDCYLEGPTIKGWWYQSNGVPYGRDREDAPPRIRNVAKPQPTSKPAGVQMGDRALVWFPVKGVEDETIFLDTIVGSLPIDRNSSAIYCIERRRLKVGDPVRCKLAPGEWTIRAIDEDEAWLKRPGSTFVSDLKYLERIA